MENIDFKSVCVCEKEIRLQKCCCSYIYSFRLFDCCFFFFISQKATHDISSTCFLCKYIYSFFFFCFALYTLCYIRVRMLHTLVATILHIYNRQSAIKRVVTEMRRVK